GFDDDCRGNRGRPRLSLAILEIQPEARRHVRLEHAQLDQADGGFDQWPPVLTVPNMLVGMFRCGIMGMAVRVRMGVDEVSVPVRMLMSMVVMSLLVVSIDVDVKFRS